MSKPVTSTMPEQVRRIWGLPEPAPQATDCVTEGCSLGDCPACVQRQANAYRGVPAPPAPLTLAGILGDIDIALARLSTIRAAVNRLPGDRELTVIRLDSMAASLRDAVEYGDRALGSWKAGS